MRPFGPFQDASPGYRIRDQAPPWRSRVHRAGPAVTWPLRASRRSPAGTGSIFIGSIAGSLGLDKDQMIKKAMRENRCLGFMYHGFYRIVEPHVYGRLGEIDRIHTKQIKGQSSQKCLGWRTMYLDKMSHVEILDCMFRYGLEDPKRNVKWDEIYLSAIVGELPLKKRLLVPIRRLFGCPRSY